MKSKIGFLIKLSGIVTVAIFSLLYYFKEKNFLLLHLYKFFQFLVYYIILKSISQFLITGA